MMPVVRMKELHRVAKAGEVILVRRCIGSGCVAWLSSAALETVLFFSNLWVCLFCEA